MSKKNLTIIFKDSCVFHTVEQILVELPEAIMKKNFELLNQFYDKSKRVLIIEVKIENKVLLLINLYNANTENEELSTLSDLNNILEKINNINAKSIQFGGDFNLQFEANLESQGGNPVLKETNTNKRKI